MTEAVLRLIVQLKDEASQQAEGLRQRLGGLKDVLGGVGIVAGGAALAGIAAFGAGMMGGVGDAREAAQIMAQTEAVITSTGGAAGRSAQEIADYAASLSAASGASLFGDSQVQEAQNLLLTFTNIKTTTLDAATAIAVDMAQALGGEPKAQAIQLGKALNDPIAGISALTRVGVTFTEEQKNQIKVLQESGDVAGAQAVILAELNKEFGGSAAAAAAADGGMAQFNDTVGEAWETLGAELLPLLNEFAAWLNSPEVQEGLATGVTALADGIRIAAQWISGTLIPAATDLYNYLAPILGPAIAEIGRALQEDLPRGVDLVVKAWDELTATVAGWKEQYIDPIVRGWEYLTSLRLPEWVTSGLAGAANALGGLSIPGLASGVTNFAGGLAYVHAGEVLANLPPGTDVIPAGQVGGMGGGLNIGQLSVTLTEPVRDARQLARELYGALREEAARYSSRNGVTGLA